MSAPPQEPEGMPTGVVARTALAGGAIAVLAVAIAFALTPARHEPPPRSIGGVDATLFEREAHGRALHARAAARLEGGGEGRLPIDDAMRRVATGERPPGAGASAFARPEDP